MSSVDSMGDGMTLMQERQYLTPLSVHDVLKKMAQEVVSDADH